MPYRVEPYQAIRHQNSKQRADAIPVFDHDEAGFYVCDRFNMVLHQKTWPHRVCGDVYNTWNYLFSVILINVFHVWLDLDIDNRCNVTFVQFCYDLSSNLGHT